MGRWLEWYVCSLKEGAWNSDGERSTGRCLTSFPAWTVGQSLEIEATVDTGAAYTTLPASLLRGLGVTPMGKRRSLLADGRRLEMDYGEARDAAINGETIVTTLVVFGADNASALNWGPIHSGSTSAASLWPWTRWNSGPHWSQPTYGSSCTRSIPRTAAIPGELNPSDARHWCAAKKFDAHISPSEEGKWLGWTSDSTPNDGDGLWKLPRREAFLCPRRCVA